MLEHPRRQALVQLVALQGQDRRLLTLRILPVAPPEEAPQHQARRAALKEAEAAASAAPVLRRQPPLRQACEARPPSDLQQSHPAIHHGLAAQRHHEHLL